MKDKVEFKIRPDGTIETIYQEGIEQFAEDLGAEIGGVCRASNVEWEELSNGQKGWTVRSARNPELALRHSEDINQTPDTQFVVSTDRALHLVVFAYRELALEWEVKFFWKLFQPKE